MKQNFIQFKGLVDSGRVLPKRFGVISLLARIWVNLKCRNEKHLYTKKDQWNHG